MQRRCALRCLPTSAAGSRSPAPMPKELRSRPSSISTGSFPKISLAIQSLSRKARADSRYRFAFGAAALDASLTGYRQRLARRDRRRVRLHDVPSARATARHSRRWGIEASSAGSRRQLRLTRQLRLSAMRPNPTRHPTQVQELRRPKHSGSIGADGSLGPAGAMEPRSPMSARTSIGRKFRPSTVVRLDSYWLAGCAGRLCGYARARAVRARDRTCSMQRYRRCRRLPDRRARPVRRDQAGGSAIIAVNSASAASLPSTLARPANLHTLERFWTNSTSSRSSTPGSTGLRNFAPSIAMK